MPENLLTVFGASPLKGLALIALLTVLIFLVGDHFGNSRFRRDNFLMLRANTDVYEPLFTVVVYAALIMCFVAASVSRTNELQKFDAARLLYWSQSEASVDTSSGLDAFNYEQAERNVFSSAKSISDVYAKIPSEDLVDSILTRLRHDNKNDFMRSVFLNFNGIVFFIVLFVYASATFQFAINTFDAPGPRLGVILIIAVMGSMLVLLTTFAPAMLSISSEMLHRQL